MDTLELVTFGRNGWPISQQPSAEVFIGLMLNM